MGYIRSFAKFCSYFSALTIITFLYQNCEDNPVAPTDGAIIQGKVVQSETGRGIEGVQVRSFNFPQSATTDSAGFYSFEVTIGDSTSRLVSLSFTKDGYEDTFISITVESGEITSVPNAKMSQTSVITETSGPATNIVLVNAQRDKIYVRGSGATETSTLTFELRDANGVPVDADHKRTVEFSINNQLNGGEFVSPTSISTDINGRASTTVNSGTVAGAIQVVAKVADTLISSSPVPVVIAGGLPHAAHFSIASAQLNFPGYNRLNVRNAITVLVGDKYSNPVPTGTVVHFETTGGVILSPAQTDDEGLGTVDLISGGPRPQGVPNWSGVPSYFGDPGYALITAQTVDETGATIETDHIVLFSGVAQISNVNPTTFNLAPNQSQLFTYNVTDQNGNPLVEGTEITVTTNNGSVAGDDVVNLGDTRIRGEGTTSFTFLLTNSKPEDIEGEDTTVTISVEGPNGRAKVDIFGTMTVTAP